MMNRFAIATFIIGFTILCTGCQSKPANIKTKPVSTNPIQLKDNVEELVTQNNVSLKIQQRNGNFYWATQYFNARIIEMLKRFSPISQIEYDQGTYDLKLCFEGYKDIYMNSQTGVFRFEGENQVFGIDSWSDEYWKRYVLKEINGEIMYSSFERDIIKQKSYMDIDKDEKADDVLLYYDSDIRLKVKDSDVPVLLGANREAVSSIVPSHQYNCDLYIKEDPANNKFQFLTGITYSFTNKYGSTSWLSCYEYKNGTIEETWSSENVSTQEIKTAGYKNGILTVSISGLRNPKKIILNDEQEKEIKKYKKYLEDKNEKFSWQDITFYLHIMPQYRFYDYDNDGDDELVTYLVAKGGPCLCITDLYYSVYEFSSDGIAFKDSFFSSYNNTPDKVFF